MTTKQKVSTNKTNQYYGCKHIQKYNIYIYIYIYYLPSNVVAVAILW